MYHLIYHSQARMAFDTPQLTELLEQSRAFNAAHDITGLLLYTPNQQFMQVLEGGEDEVRHLYYERIAVDARHHDCVVLSEGPWSRRSFPNWRMGFLTDEQSDLHTVPGYVELSRLRTLLPVLAPSRPALVHMLLEFIERYTDPAEDPLLGALPE
ncbi:BLUF domain-containing protein [Hymenobacter sp. CRA2]|uniref:BLUF domain-containing protein n=1 Tax=Hymenobacter sp. CRA2 TaxID=1955620 RepID=UPI0009D08A34|nr:BLUF domain-containing protein [Hymenobacter sp. CRA2]OON67234.1 hypothetical protein B0919_19090 [Hymenobacter sp. CRA2]